MQRGSNSCALGLPSRAVSGRRGRGEEEHAEESVGWWRWLQEVNAKEADDDDLEQEEEQEESEVEVVENDGVRTVSLTNDFGWKVEAHPVEVNQDVAKDDVRAEEPKVKLTGVTIPPPPRPKPTTFDVQLRRATLQQPWGMAWIRAEFDKGRRVLEGVVATSPADIYNEAQKKLGERPLESGDELVAVNCCRTPEAAASLKGLLEATLTFQREPPRAPTPQVIPPPNLAQVSLADAEAAAVEAAEIRAFLAKKAEGGARAEPKVQAHASQPFRVAAAAWDAQHGVPVAAAVAAASKAMAQAPPSPAAPPQVAPAKASAAEEAEMTARGVQEGRSEKVEVQEEVAGWWSWLKETEEKERKSAVEREKDMDDSASDQEEKSDKGTTRIPGTGAQWKGAFPGPPPFMFGGGRQDVRGASARFAFSKAPSVRLLADFLLQRTTTSKAIPPKAPGYMKPLPKSGDAANLRKATGAGPKTKAARPPPPLAGSAARALEPPPLKGSMAQECAALEANAELAPQREEAAKKAAEEEAAKKEEATTTMANLLEAALMPRKKAAKVFCRGKLQDGDLSDSPPREKPVRKPYSSAQTQVGKSGLPSGTKDAIGAQKLGPLDGVLNTPGRLCALLLRDVGADDSDGESDNISTASGEGDLPDEDLAKQSRSRSRSRTRTGSGPFSPSWSRSPGQRRHPSWSRSPSQPPSRSPSRSCSRTRSRTRSRCRPRRRGGRKGRKGRGRRRNRRSQSRPSPSRRSCSQRSRSQSASALAAPAPAAPAGSDLWRTAPRSPTAQPQPRGAPAAAGVMENLRAAALRSLAAAARRPGATAVGRSLAENGPRRAAPYAAAQVPKAGAYGRAGAAKVPELLIAPPRGPPPPGPQSPWFGGPLPEDLADTEVTMQVLARHAVRLGASGPGLVRALMAAHLQVSHMMGEIAVPCCWDFLSSPDGIRAYLEEKHNVVQFYNQVRDVAQIRASDQEIRKMLPEFVGKLRDSQAQPPDTGPAVPVAQMGMIRLPVTDIRFAHDGQREHFGRNAAEKRSILQLAVELLTGVTMPEQVPKFKVCHVNGNWYANTGNRRLGAFRLANRFAPHRFATIAVQAVPVDPEFFFGRPGMQAKLTTGRNGADCEGRWMMIWDTGEAVGRSQPGCNEYGADLLSLLPHLGGQRPVIACAYGGDFVGQGPPLGTHLGASGPTPFGGAMAPSMAPPLRQVNASVLGGCTSAEASDEEARTGVAAAGA